jgi:hypothetical protein
MSDLKEKLENIFFFFHVGAGGGSRLILNLSVPSIAETCDLTMKY